MKRFRRLLSRRFFIKLLAGLLLLSTIPYALFHWYFVDQIRADMSHQSRQLAENNLRSTALYVSDTLLSAQKILYYMTADDGMFGGVSRLKELDVGAKSELLESMRLMASMLGPFARLCLYDTRNGTVFASNYGITDIENERFSWLEAHIGRAMETRSVYVTPPFHQRLSYSGELSQYYCAVIQPPFAGRHVVSICMLDLGNLIYGHLDAMQMDPAMYTCYITDQSGRLIYHPDMNLVAADTSSPQEAADPNVIRITQSIDIVSLQLIAEINAPKLYAWADQAIRLVNIVALILIGVMILLAVGLSLRLYSPVRKLVDDIAPDESESAPEFHTIRRAFHQVYSQYSAAVQSMEGAHRTLRRNALIARMKGMTSSEADDALYGVLITRAPVAASRKALDDALAHLYDTAHYVEEDVLYCAYTSSVPLDTLVQVLGSAGLADAPIAVSETHCPANDLYAATCRTFFAYAMMDLTGVEGIHSLEHLSENAADTLRESACFGGASQCSGDDVGRLLGSGLQAKLFNERALALLYRVLFLEGAEATHLLSDVNRQLIKLLNNPSPTGMRRLVERTYKKLSEPSEGAEGAQVARQYVGEIDRYIESRYATLISLGDVAEHLGLSKQRLCEVIRSAHNTTFVNYLNQFRVQKAKEMLAASSAGLSQISMETGFSSTSYFIKVFKGLTGLTPGDYRRYIAEKERNEHENHPRL